MIEEDKLPAFEKDAFCCPQCNTFAQQEWFPLSNIEGITKDLSLSSCSYCKEYSIWKNKELIYPEELFKLLKSEINDDITREKLNKVVNRHMENADSETARNYIKSWGERIDDFNVEEELKKFDDGEYLPGFWPWIHRDIIKVSKQLFEDKHYAHSVESAFKEVNSRVKKIYKNKTGKEEDGSSLMMKAFTFDKDNTGQITKAPIIQLTDLMSISDIDIQNGYRFIFAGSIMAFRNPKAHENQNITKKSAAHSIFVASKLMYRLDDSNY